MHTVVVGARAVEFLFGSVTLERRRTTGQKPRAERDFDRVGPRGTGWDGLEFLVAERARSGIPSTAVYVVVVRMRIE